ncbi:hypothetical protein B296_00045645 [Ensete ventricosum]|uniref:Uncharacterized protein n=1 Tax=Ensete ventricosum TaxID=4639 RepID=A0A426Z6Q4_ENSVE|nr:hypothetical protein B296_00045645 [Ensete ventricosum]
MQVAPQADRVLIRLEELPEVVIILCFYAVLCSYWKISLEQKTAGGVLLPKSAVKFERYLMGEVLIK